MLSAEKPVPEEFAEPAGVLPAEKDPMGRAILEYYRTGRAAKLSVFSPGFDEDEIPVSTLFRELAQMPDWERKALDLADGLILDVGAGSGCHAAELMRSGKTVEAIDISALSVQVMRERGIRAFASDLFAWGRPENGRKYDTVLMLMNGSGIIGSLSRIGRFFTLMENLLRPNGCLLMDSSDIRYLFDGDDMNEAGAVGRETVWGTVWGAELGSEWGSAEPYYGEIRYRMRYKHVIGKTFPWLYLDFPTLSYYAARHGFEAEIVAEGGHYEYLARLKKVRG